ncbi:hypothetical protein ACIQF6_21260 [Kitasatospora sp. NPDC092948]|uniref:hypothetical protein n=1 Tax=Kitasatospora sp. NPDC092948 TaxID=3364088 RepID=UPI0037FF6225
MCTARKKTESAREVFDAPAVPDDDTWEPAADRIRRTPARAAAVPPTGPKGLRGRPCTPTGHAAGMTGRWAYLGDTYSQRPVRPGAGRTRRRPPGGGLGGRR